MGVALERHAGGGQTIRAVCAIPALAGSWRHVGGGLLQMPLWEFPVDWARVSRPDFIRPGTRVVNNLQLGRALVGDMQLDPLIMGLYIYNTNPVSQAPETNKIVRGLSREDLFFVTAEHFVTDTAAYADIVLPATMAGEHDDMMFSWGHFYLTINEKAIEPRGEAKSNAGIDMEYFRRHGYFHLAVGTPDDRLPHAEGKFPTPSGKVEFLVKDAKNFVAPPFRMMYEAMQSGEDVDPLPGYVPPRESAASNPELAKRYPLNVISPKSHGFLNSCYANEPHKIKGQGEQFVLMSPTDAAARGVREGDPVRVFNDRGDFEGLARVTDDVRDGVIVATLGYWRSLNRSDGSVNSISSAEFCGLGRAPTFSDNLVQVVRVN